jgi:exonuclease III
MRIVTWNCYPGKTPAKLAYIASLKSDIAVLQELSNSSQDPPPELFWIGDSPRQGVGVIAGDGYYLEIRPQRSDVPKWAVPLEVRGPANFNLLAVWTRKEGRYIEGLHQAVEVYRDWLRSGPSIIIGDFNSNSIWDHEHHAASHTMLVQRLADEFGLVSSYHHFVREAHGAEQQATFYYRWQQTSPFHIDYCFVPEAWADRITQVEVGSYDSCATLSDHRPLVVDIADVL